MRSLCNHFLPCLLVRKHGLGDVNSLVLLGSDGGDHVSRRTKLGRVEGSSRMRVDFKGVLGLDLEEFLFNVHKAESLTEEVFYKLYFFRVLVVVLSLLKEILFQLSYL